MHERPRQQLVRGRHNPVTRENTTPTGRDEVDDLVAAWRRERPDLDVAPLEVLSRVTRLARHLDRARGQAFSRHGLEGWEFDVLAALRRCGAPYRLSPGRLLQQTLVTSGTMTNRIDRLAARGLVERHPSPDDRRSVMVELTEAGARQGRRCLDRPARPRAVHPGRARPQRRRTARHAVAPRLDAFRPPGAAARTRSVGRHVAAIPQHRHHWVDVDLLGQLHVVGEAPLDQVAPRWCLG